MTTPFEFHPLAEIFPQMSDDEFQRLCDDIRENGQREKIWVFQNKIIDGRNRYNACQVLGIEPITREWAGNGSLINFIVSLNLHRRHLSESQRAMIAAKLANMERGYNPSIDGLFSQSQASKLLNVSPKSVERAKKILNNGVSALTQKVETGEFTVSYAFDLASLPKNKQIRLIKKGRDKGNKILTTLKIKSLQKTTKDFKTVCLLCNPEAIAGKESVSAMMQVLSKKHPRFARYFNSIVDELEELDLADSVLEDSEKIKTAIRSGYQTFGEIFQMTKIDKDQINYCLSLLMEYEEVTAIEQGGKTDVARGAKKLLYRIVEQEKDYD